MRKDITKDTHFKFKSKSASPGNQTLKEFITTNNELQSLDTTHSDTQEVIGMLSTNYFYW